MRRNKEANASKTPQKKKKKKASFVVLGLLLLLDGKEGFSIDLETHFG